MKTANKKAWKGKRVLITGITGFVGSALAARLIDAGASVIGLIRDEVIKSNFYLLGLDRKITIVRGDLDDRPLLERILEEYQPEFVYHLAAQTIVGTANDSPYETFRSNVLGTVHLLEACRRKPPKAIIVASTDKAYGSHDKLPYKEDYPLLAEFPYDVSKACADMIARCYFKTYGLPVVVTRFANIYGPGDFNYSRIVPDTLRRVLMGQRPVLRSDGTPERDYLYVDDVVELYTLLSERIDRARGEAFNAGHEKPVKVIDLVEKIISVCGKKGIRPKILGRGKLRGEIDRQWLDGGKAKRLLGWEPKTSLDEGLKKTVAWYATHLHFNSE